MKPISLRKDQKIGAGVFGTVYRISKCRVVKVFRRCAKHNIEDEIKSSSLHPSCLPVLKVVDVILPNGKKQKALLKKYIPNDVTRAEFLDFRDLVDADGTDLIWDLHEKNVRKDSRGRIYIIDTQTNPW